MTTKTKTARQSAGQCVVEADARWAAFADAHPCPETEGAEVVAEWERLDRARARAVRVAGAVRRQPSGK